MAKAVFTTKIVPGYKDLPEQKYHFPKTYLNQVREAVGDYIVYYEPRRSSIDLSSRGGRQSYFAVARVKDVVEDRETAGHYYALVEHYLDFERPVPFLDGSSYYESSLRKPDGSTSKGAFGRSVRLVPDSEFDNILRAGFAPILQTPRAIAANVAPEISEEAAEYRRPVVELTILKPFRERSFI